MTGCWNERFFFSHFHDTMKLEWLDAYLSGDLRGESAAFIESALKSDDALREAYFQQVRLDAALRVLLEDEELSEVTPEQFAAGVMARIATESPAMGSSGDRRFAKSVLMEILDEKGLKPRPTMGRWDWAKASLVAAAAVAVTVFALQSVRLGDSERTTGADSSDYYVAQITGSTDGARWTQRNVAADGSESFSQSGDGWLRPGEISLTEGVAEITFTSGARIFLEAPSVLRVERPGRTYLSQGRLTAEVPRAATGFVVNTPRVNVVDIGTRFGVSVEKNGDTEVHVLQGVVEVSRLIGNASPLTLEEGMAVRADDRPRSELQPVEFRGEVFPLRLDGVEPARGVERFLHYRFNETGGPEIQDSGKGLVDRGGEEASLFPHPANPVQPKRTLGRIGGGLQFSGGERFSSPVFHEVAGDGPMTLALWMRLPPAQDADPDVPPIAVLMADSDQTSETGAKLTDDTGQSPLWSMAWNADPRKGKTGALTVVNGHGYVVGTTDLRDGRWHHVAFRYFGTPGSLLTPHLHLYVDGRLEAVSGRSEATVEEGVIRRLQIGGGHASKPFEGAIDEVFFAPAEVLPGVIQSLAEFGEIR